MMARFWKPELTRPEAIIPATKYWLKVTPGAIDSENTEPNIAKRISGNAMVKTTDSRWRMNCLNSILPRNRPSVSVDGVLSLFTFLLIFASNHL